MRYIVTGASSGIGLATAEALALLGHSVIAIARREPELKKLQTRFGELIEIVAANLASDDGIALLSATANRYERIDGIVHAAGSLIEPADYRSLKTDNLVNDMRVHVATPIALNNALEPLLINARILFIDSYSASSVRVGWGGYSIVKAAAQMAARLAQEELKQAQVIRVFPGAVRTQLVESVLNSKQHSPAFETYSALDAAGEIAPPAEVGKFIAGILCNATDAQLATKEHWDISHTEDHLL